MEMNLEQQLKNHGRPIEQSHSGSAKNEKIQCMEDPPPGGGPTTKTGTISVPGAEEEDDEPADSDGKTSARKSHKKLPDACNGTGTQYIDPEPTDNLETMGGTIGMPTGWVEDGFSGLGDHRSAWKNCLGRSRTGKGLGIENCRSLGLKDPPPGCDLSTVGGPGGLRLPGRVGRGVRGPRRGCRAGVAARSMAAWSAPRLR